MSARKKATSKKARTAEKAVAAPKKARATAKATKASKVAKVEKAEKVAKTSKTAPATSKVAASLPNKAINQKQSKSQIYAELSEIANVSKNDVRNVVAAVRNMIERHVKPKGSGEIIIPDLGIKVRRVSKKATKARMGRNPFTGEEIQIPAKPARKSVKVSALKTLKALIEE